VIDIAVLHERHVAGESLRALAREASVPFTRLRSAFLARGLAIRPQREAMGSVAVRARLTAAHPSSPVAVRHTCVYCRHTSRTTVPDGDRFACADVAACERRILAGAA
jgi:hypothetical protein